MVEGNVHLKKASGKNRKPTFKYETFSIWCF